jgi:Cys-tRNA synthase (O-phospho-L-seryl-tRNA:Cys-tRNA synthase)
MTKHSPLKRSTLGMINIDPLQRGGILTPEARDRRDQETTDP